MPIRSRELALRPIVDPQKARERVLRAAAARSMRDNNSDGRHEVKTHTTISRQPRRPAIGYGEKIQVRVVANRDDEEIYEWVLVSPEIHYLKNCNRWQITAEVHGRKVFMLWDVEAKTATAKTPFGFSCEWKPDR